MMHLALQLYTTYITNNIIYRLNLSDHNEPVPNDTTNVIGVEEGMTIQKNESFPIDNNSKTSYYQSRSKKWNMAFYWIVLI